MTTASGAITASVCHGTLSIGGVSMNTSAWAVLNNYVMWQPAETRGEDILIPYSPGLLARQRRATATKRTLEILVIGDVNSSGAVNADRITGLVTNISYLEANVFAPVDSPSGTRTVTLSLPGGGSRSGEAHVGPAQYGSVISGALTVTLDLSLPAGELA